MNAHFLRALRAGWRRRCYADGDRRLTRASIESLEARTLLSGLAPAAETPGETIESHDTLYFNYATGDDANDGLTPSSAKKTVEALNAELAVGPVLHWPLQDVNVASKVIEATGNGTGTTLVKAGTVTAGVPGPDPLLFPSAVQLDGKSSIQSAEPSAAQTSSIAEHYTMMAWAKVVGTPTSATLFRRVTSGRSGLVLGTDAGGSFVLDNQNPASGSYSRSQSFIPVPDGDWHHIAYTYDGTVINGYLDGTQVISNLPANFTLDLASPGTWYIGSWNSLGAGGFDGGICDPMVWDRALTPGEIADYVASGFKPRTTSDPIRKVVIDLSLSDMPLTSPLVIHGNFAGGELECIGDGFLNSYETITTWQKTPGFDNVYETTDWEKWATVEQDGVPMIRVTGSTLAATGLDSTPGAFWNDNQGRLYVNAGGSDPSLNGHLYQRPLLWGNATTHAVTARNRGGIIRNLRVKAGYMADPINADNSGIITLHTHYCLLATEALGGLTIIGGTLIGGSKHAFGTLGGDAGGSLLIDGLFCDRENPYLPTGTYTAFVSYSAENTTYLNCIARNNAIAWYNHGVQSDQSIIRVYECDFGSGEMSTDTNPVSCAHTVEVRSVIAGKIALHNSVVTKLAPTPPTLSGAPVIDGSGRVLAGLTLSRFGCTDGSGFASGTGPGGFVLSAASGDTPAVIAWSISDLPVPGTLKLWLAPAATTGQELTVSYSSETGGLHDIVGNALQSLDAVAVTNASRVVPGFPSYISISPDAQYTWDASSGELALSAGALTFTDDSAAYPLDVPVNVDATGAGSHLLFNTTQHLAGLALADGADAVLVSPDAGGPAASQPLVLELASLTLAGDAQLDLAGNAMILDDAGATPAQLVREWVLNGRTGLTPALLTSTNNPAGAPALGFVENSLLHLPVFLGQPLESPFNQVLVRSTLAGDANLDGAVDQSDYLNLIAGMGRADAHWLLGDLNDDGVVGADDYAEVAAALGAGTPAAAGPALRLTAIESPASVPAPGTRVPAGQQMASIAPAAVTTSARDASLPDARTVGVPDVIEMPVGASEARWRVFTAEQLDVSIFAGVDDRLAFL